MKKKTIEMIEQNINAKRKARQLYRASRFMYGIGAFLLVAIDNIGWQLTALAVFWLTSLFIEFLADKEMDQLRNLTVNVNVNEMTPEMIEKLKKIAMQVNK